MAKGSSGNGNGAGKNGASAKLGAQVQKLVASAQSMTTAFAALGLPALTSEERVHTNGRLRGGEPAAMTSIFDAMDAFPGVFAALAAKDGGTDANAVETAPARAELAQAQALAPLADALSTLSTLVSDAILASAAAAKDVSVPAYAIGKASAATDPKVRKVLAPALDFYSAQAQKRVRDKKVAAGRAKKASKASAPRSPAG